MPLNSSFTCN